jgi:AcrR family transcriptional regulator
MKEILIMPEASENKRRRSQSKHSAIIESAIELADVEGYAATTIERVAAHAEVGKATIYRWWKSKADLYTEVYQELVPVSELGRNTGNPQADLSSLLKAVFRHYRQTPAGKVLAGLISDSQLQPSARDALKDNLVAGRKPLLLDILETARSGGHLAASTDTVLLADALTGLIWRYLLVEPDALRDDMADRMVDQLVFRGAA